MRKKNEDPWNPSEWVFFAAQAKKRRNPSTDRVVFVRNVPQKTWIDMSGLSARLGVSVQDLAIIGMHLVLQLERGKIR
tara:strand:- start:98 stop:331 length:234 start_codon:yes stop_codon:yes gene_type:complete